ncbi:ESCRT-III subunit protein VPS20 [Ascoidea rubescens DSM 1968]|uniref:SNF7 family protein n=1 Tax=Ascoidea rubescens DSM 1968 TaxID=1344418 RepID=A0A1D2VDD3_9ASCO|nr:SNF7 family protein [Ascoidea rubescens DSM 1968]ODV59592.1 SNF7 family protein [Ascoidea rubescens DSM 1968]
MGQTTSSPKITPQDKAVLQLKLQRDKLEQYQASIQSVIDKEVLIAKIFLKKKNKERALLSLKKKKYQESLLNQSFNQLNSLDELISTIEFKQIEKNIFYGLTQGNLILKKLNEELNIEKIEKLLDETDENISYQEEVSTLLSQSITNKEEEEVNQELLSLEREVLGIDKQQSVNEESKDELESYKLPQVPNTAILDDVSEFANGNQIQAQKRKQKLKLVAN